MRMFKRAERRRAKARIALAGPSGSGKSMSALLLAKGMGGKIAAIDTENESLSLYAHVVPFDVAVLKAPFNPERYIEMIKAAESAGYDTIIIDSLTHEWAGPGGILEIHDSMPGNSWANWAKVTPRHNALINAMLQSPCHIIATMRSKTEYIQTERDGKKKVEKTGTAPQQRDGMDYEFTVCLDITTNHIAGTSKDRTGLFDGKFEVITEEHGKMLKEWLEDGVEAPVTPAPPVHQPQPKQTQAEPPKQKKSKLQAAMEFTGMSMGQVREISKKAFSKDDLRKLTKDEQEKLFHFMQDIHSGEISLDNIGKEQMPDPVAAPPPTKENGSAAEPSSNSEVTSNQLKRLFTLASLAQVPADEAKRLMESMYGVNSSKQLTRQQYDEMCAMFEQQAQDGVPF